VHGALQRQADAALEEACNKAGATDEEVISALLSLVTVDEQGRPTKRRVAFDEFASVIAAEFDPFVSRRLLSTEAVAEKTFIAVAHEAFLLNWPPLTVEIEAQAAALRARRVVENEAADWVAGGRDAGVLFRGGKLTKAVVDTGAELEVVRDNAGGQTSGPKRRFGFPGLASRQRRLVTRVELNDTGRQFLETSMRTDRVRRRRRVMQMASIIAILTLIAGAAVVGFFQANYERDKAQASARQATATRLQIEAAEMLSQHRPGGDIRAFQKLIAAQALGGDKPSSALIDAVNQRLTTEKLWDTGAPVQHVAISDDGQLMATAAKDGGVQVWNAATGQQLARLVFDDPFFSDIVFLPDSHRLATCAEAVQLWDAETGRISGPPLNFGPAGRCLGFSRDGHLVAGSTAFGFGHVVLRNMDTGHDLGELPEVSDDRLPGVDRAVFSGDGHRLATINLNGKVHLWDVENRQPLLLPLLSDFARNASPLGLFSVAVSFDGRRIAAGSLGGLRVWDVDSGRDITKQNLDTFDGAVTDLVFSRDGRRLAATARNEKTVNVWNVETGVLVGQPLTGPTDEVASLLFSTDGHRLAVGSLDHTVRWWNIDTGQQAFDARLPGPAWVHAVVSSDGRSVATLDPAGTVHVYDTDPTERRDLPLSGRPQGVVSLAISADGRRLATVSDDDKTLQLWDVDTGDRIGTSPPGHFGAETIMSFSPDRHRLATGTFDGTLQLWDADSGQPLGTVVNGSRNGRFLGMAFSSDGGRLVTGGVDATVRLWNLDVNPSGATVLTGHSNFVRSVAFSPDADHVASGSDDGTVRIWDVHSGKSLLTLTGHTGAVTDVAFSTDGRVLASTSFDSTVRLWDAYTGRPLAAPLTGDYVQSLTFGFNGERLVTTSYALGNGTVVRFWPATASADMLCDKLTTNMSRQAWGEWISTDPNVEYRELCPGLPPAA
jgi:WD40 repeat protein